MTPMPTTYPRDPDIPPHPLELKSYGGRLLNSFASYFCAGCGYGIVGQMFDKVFGEEGLDPYKYPLVIGIGCYTQIITIIGEKVQKMNALHGRAPAFATGVKMANPELKPVIFSGDGDALGIGGNHFLHLCRRNLDATLLVFNNSIYGMTGGQVAPTTPAGYRSSTTYGRSFEKNLDAVKLAIAAGATHVARVTVAHPRTFMKYLKKALYHKGTSVIEVITPCVTYFGRKNQDFQGRRMDTGGKMLEWIKARTVWRNQARLMNDAELEGKWVLGEFKYDTSRPEFCEEYQKLINKAMEPDGENHDQEI
ncbi:MAG: thiamine pyrophosphate-dependent enzyme [Promethearchaeota archaeon]